MPDPAPRTLPALPGVAVWAEGPGDTDATKLAARLGVPCVVSEEPPVHEWIRWLLFYEDGILAVHSSDHPDFLPLSVDYAEGEFARRWKKASRNDLLPKALGLKKGIRTVCDPTCGLGYDAFLLATFKDLEVTACERHPVIAELTMNALLRMKEWGRFEEFPLYFHFGDGREFLLKQEAGAFDAVYLDPMYPREEKQSAAQKKEMLLVRELVGKDPDANALFDEAWRVARRRVVVKRPDDASRITSAREPDAVIEGKTVRYDIYLKA